jgi:hypothetical protein
MVVDVSQVVDGVVSVISAVPNVGTVGDREGGKSTWASAPARSQTYWMVDKSGRVPKPQNLSAFANRSETHQVVGVSIEGWMPLDPALNSVKVWLKRLDDVMHYLSRRATLNNCARMLELPSLVVHDVQMYTSPSQNDIPVLCHHCRIEFPALLLVH